MVAVRPNKTLVRAVLGTFTPAADGFGGNLELDVRRNDSASADDDFLRPEIGRAMTAFAAESPSLAPGSEVDVQLTFIGGPRGGRAVVQSLHPARTPETQAGNDAPSISDDRPA